MGDSPWLIRELEDESFPSATTQNFAQLRWVAQEPEQTPRIRFPILRQLSFSPHITKPQKPCQRSICAQYRLQGVSRYRAKAQSIPGKNRVRPPPETG